MAEAVSDASDLLRQLGITSRENIAASEAIADFPLRVPQAYLRRIRTGDINDPLLRQVLPLQAEFDRAPGFCTNPVGDTDAMATTGVIKKYDGRVLLITTGACAIHCRYCYRRHFPYQENQLSHGALQTALRYIKDDPEILEVILSGGDPLCLSNQRLELLINAIAEVPHVRYLRLHTRVPVVLPNRIDRALLESLDRCPLRIALVVHVNHAREIDHSAARALQAIKRVNVTLLNQSVLLRGVNDTVEDLIQLSESLYGAGVLPYYLHLLDRVAGSSHFEVCEPRALALHGALRAKLPGYLVPRLIREHPQASSKQVLG